jgi:hypothetical protein
VHWPLSLSTTASGGSATPLMSILAYTATGQATSALLGGGTASYSASYDALGRLGTTTLIRGSDKAQVFSQSRGYDAVGNVLSVNTTLQAGTDNQAFCYDEFNRLTWASSASGAIPCGGTNTAGTLTSAQYGPNSYAYDALDRLTSTPGGSYTYGDSAHLHAVSVYGRYCTTSSRPKCTTSSRPKCTVWSAAYAG